MMAGLLMLGTLALSQAESTPHRSPATPSASLPATLPPDMFTGTVRQAYQVAADMPGCWPNSTATAAVIAHRATATFWTASATPTRSVDPTACMRRWTRTRCL